MCGKNTKAVWQWCDTNKRKFQTLTVLILTFSTKSPSAIYSPINSPPVRLLDSGTDHLPGKKLSALPFVAWTRCCVTCVGGASAGFGASNLRDVRGSEEDRSFWREADHKVREVDRSMTMCSDVGGEIQKKVSWFKKVEKVAVKRLKHE